MLNLELLELKMLTGQNRILSLTISEAQEKWKRDNKTTSCVDHTQRNCLCLFLTNETVSFRIHIWTILVKSGAEKTGNVMENT
jgi:hypothetical protein